MLPYLICFQAILMLCAGQSYSSSTSLVCDVPIRSSSFIFTRMQHSWACFYFFWYFSVIIVAFSDHVVRFCLFSLLLLLLLPPLNCRFSVFAANFLSKFSSNNRPTFVLPRDRGIGDSRTDKREIEREKRESIVIALITLRWLGQICWQFR